MGYKSIIDNFKYIDIIYREDFITQLCDEGNFTYENAEILLEFASLSGFSNIETIDIKKILENNLKNDFSNYKETEKKAEEFWCFLKQLQRKQWASKYAVSILEESMIATLDNITRSTEGKVQFSIQVTLIYQTIGSIFKWEPYDAKAFVNKNNLKEYIIDNMEEYKDIYEKLFNNLIYSVEGVELSYKDNFFILPTTKEAVMHSVAKKCIH